MKSLKYISMMMGAFLLGASSCDSYDDYLTDFDYSSVYFPYQQPVRTVILGEESSFNVGVVLAGKRENTTTEKAKFEIQETLLEGTGWELLPQEYYTLSHDSEMVIKPGSFQGLVKVSLTEAFFADNRNIEGHFALPIRITEATTDSVLVGDVASGVKAMDYMIPVVKYMHLFEANWYHHGVDSTFDKNGTFVKRDYYSKKDMVENEVWKLETLSSTAVTSKQIGVDKKGGLTITLAEDNQVVLSAAPTSAITEVTSVAGAYQKEKKQMHLKYNYVSADGMTHQVTDTLTFRNREMSLELW